ncbi:rod shape-determining protein MreC [Empedobacter brevis]|uniref:rod shape-determining protein MreC n=1 Tax=Empedobacter brevis TaxID=247 RepID=UPI0028A65B5C|nr:rod shape-determining protein MreC [Empedobacter brevis]
MQYILNAIRRNGMLLIFVFLELIALFLVFKKNIYHETILASASTSFTGYVDDKIAKITNFVHLPQTNKELMDENAFLREQLVHLGIKDAKTKKFYKADTLGYHQIYSFVPTEIVNNSVIKTQNLLTIDKGTNDGIEKGDGIITNNGVIGIVTYAGKNYSRAISLLNKDININARIKGNQYFGTVKWDGKDPRFVQLYEIPKYIEVKKGDIIETDGKSPVFPEGIMIGKVVSKGVDETGELKVQVRLKQDFANLAQAYVVTNLNKVEIQQVEKSDTITNTQNVQ